MENQENETVNVEPKSADSTEPSPGDIQISPEEYEAAQVAASKTGYTYEHKFKVPFEVGKETYDRLFFDWGGLTGQDAINIETEMAQLKIPLVAGAFSSEYQIRLMSKACSEKISSDAFKSMSLFDFNKIRSQARSFLLKSE